METLCAERLHRPTRMVVVRGSLMGAFGELQLSSTHVAQRPMLLTATLELAPVTLPDRGLFRVGCELADRRVPTASGSGCAAAQAHTVAIIPRPARSVAQERCASSKITEANWR
jgi:hypothetical protein